MRITISGPQFAEAIQEAAWFVEAPEIQQAIDRLSAVLECTACQAERTAGLLKDLLIDCPPRHGMSNIAHREWLQGFV